jgi:ankyrin repeat protein
MLAAGKGHDEIIKLLLEKGADPRQSNLSGNNALLMAVTHNRRKTAQLLLALGLDVNVADNKSITPLIAAAYNGNLRILDMLLDAGADSTIVDTSGKSAIVYATGRGYLEIVRRLLEHSDKIDANTRYGNDLTALMWAAGHGNDVPALDGLAVVEYLLAKGANPDLTDNRGRSAIHIAAERGHTAIVERLLQQGAVADAEDRNGITPLSLASNPALRQILKNPAIRDNRP